MICNCLFAPIYHIFFGEEAPCLSPKGKNIVQNYGDWYMTSDEVYIKILGSTKALHWFPHFVPDTLLLQEIAYQSYVHATSFHKDKKGLWPPFPLSIGVYKIENFKQNKEEISINYLSSGSKRLLFEGMLL